MDASEPRSKNVARREAQPIAWDDLSSDQKEAVKQAAGILADLAGAPNPGEESKSAKEAHLDLFLPQIDIERLNHVVLLDGDRGSGKTAVLVTLLDGWSRILRNRIEPRHKGLVEVLKGTENVVPIGLIDLQPLPKSTNLLLYLVGRFQRVVEAIEQVYAERGSRSKSTADRRHAWHGVSAEEPACAAKWRDLVHAAALGWNGDIGQRRGSLDPEAFVAELEQAEKRRLDIVSSFRHLIDALVKDYELLDAQPKKDPLFLLAIDDADMNPEKAAEALDLVRTLWHPRVAYLLTGDSNLFLAMLRSRSAKSLGDAKEEGIVNFANDLACDIYNKAIPPAHRCRFVRLAPQIRLERMEKLLQPLTFNSTKLAAQFPNLYELFASNEQLQQALPARERSLADLKVRIQLELSPLTRKKNPTHEVIAALCRSEFTPWRERPSEHVPHYGAEEDLLQAARATRNWDWRASRKNVIFLRNDIGWDLVVQKTPRWEATDRGLKQSVNDDKLASGMLAWDIVARELCHREALPTIEPMGLLGLAVRVEYRRDKDLYSFAWPLPDWPFFADYFAFGKAWSSQVPDYNVYDEGQVDTLAFQFVETVVSHLEGAKQEPSKKVDWEKLAERVGALANGADKIAAQWALSRAGLLAAPESGLSDKVANAWLEALAISLDKRWESARQALRAERRERIVFIKSGQSNDESAKNRLLNELNKKYDRYQWQSRVEGSAPDAPRTSLILTQLLDLLRRIPTPWVPQRKTIRDYFNLQSREAALRNELIAERVNPNETASSKVL